MTDRPTDHEATALDPAIKKLRAQRRQALPTDEFITDYDGVDESGHKYREHTVPGDGQTTMTIQSDLTAMYQAAPSTTSDIALLRLEAELVADGVDLENPHLPASEAIMAQARERLAADDLTPAWEHRL